MSFATSRLLVVGTLRVEAVRDKGLWLLPLIRVVLNEINHVEKGISLRIRTPSIVASFERQDNFDMAVGASIL